MTQVETEQEQIRASQAGDHQAFAGLVERYQKMIDSLTFRMSGSMADAEDLAQETFIQAYHQLGNFRGDAKFSSWLYRIAVNNCLNFKKRSQHRERLHQSWAEERQHQEPFADVVAAEVQKALLQLNPKQRAAVVLTTYEGLNHAEAARILGCSETTVSWRLFAARAKLKGLLKHLRQGGNR